MLLLAAKSAKADKSGIAEQMPDEMGRSNAAGGTEGPNRFIGREDGSLYL